MHFEVHKGTGHLRGKPLLPFPRETRRTPPHLSSCLPSSDVSCGSPPLSRREWPPLLPAPTTRECRDPKEPLLKVWEGQDSVRKEVGVVGFHSFPGTETRRVPVKKKENEERGRKGRSDSEVSGPWSRRSKGHRSSRIFQPFAITDYPYSLTTFKGSSLDDHLGSCSNRRVANVSDIVYFPFTEIKVSIVTPSPTEREG